MLVRHAFDQFSHLSPFPLLYCSSEPETLHEALTCCSCPWPTSFLEKWTFSLLPVFCPTAIPETECSQPKPFVISPFSGSQYMSFLAWQKLHVKNFTLQIYCILFYYVNAKILIVLILCLADMWPFYTGYKQSINELRISLRWKREVMFSYSKRASHFPPQLHQN